MTLTPKETEFLKDFQTQEQLCIDKYTKYANEACNGALKNLFDTLAKGEQKHLDTIHQIMNGQEPQTQPAPSATQSVYCETTPYSDTQSKQIDTFMCQDMLAMEKHASSSYNTGIFEFSQPKLRDTLATIQKEEQNHGEQLYTYMTAHGMIG